MKLVTGGDNLVNGVQCNELFGGIALKNHAFYDNNGQRGNNNNIINNNIEKITIIS